MLKERTEKDGLTPKMDHLVCFLPGTVIMSVTNGIPLSKLTTPLTDIQQEDLYLASELLATCYHTYAVNPTNLGPEIVFFNKNGVGADMIIKPTDAHSLLRPETLESLFYFWRITGNQTYRDWGWKIWQGMEKYAKVEEGGYTSLNDVTTTEGRGTRDKMESFFMGETIKYLYLLFSDDPSLYPLDKYVFNTEAHAFPLFRKDF